jgi:hypothetical protein
MPLRFVYRWVALITTALVLTNCASLSGKNETVEMLVSETFYVASTKSNIAFESGRYANLYNMDSYAVWNDAPTREDPVVPAQLIDGATIKVSTAEPIVVDCFIGSKFSDSSIAFDAVKLRNLEVFIEIEGENKLLPSGIELISDTDEKQVGALRQYRRHVRVTFPGRDVQTGDPVLHRDVKEIRLVFFGFHSKYAFEWQNASPRLTRDLTIHHEAPIVEWAKSKETYQVMKSRYGELRKSRFFP